MVDLATVLPGMSMSSLVQDALDATSRGLFSSIRKKIKRAVDAAVREVTRGIESLIKNLFKPFMFIIDVVRALVAVCKRLIDRLPQLLTPKAPDLGRVGQAILDLVEALLFMILDLIVGILAAIWAVVTNTVDWVLAKFPVASWQSMDNTVARLWLPLSMGARYGASLLFPTAVEQLFPGFSIHRVRGTLGWYHGTLCLQYAYRVAGPFVGGLVCVLLCVPEWVVACTEDALDLVELTSVELTHDVADAVGDAIRALGDGIGSFVSQLWTELTAPVRYYKTQAEYILAPLKDL